MKYLVCLLMLGKFAFGQPYDSSFVIKPNLKWFIDTTHNEHTETITKFFNYVIYVSSDLENLNEGLCYTFGYIQQSSEFELIEPDYYFEFNDEFVLVRLEQGLSTEMFKREDIDLISLRMAYGRLDGHEAAKVVQKLFPSDIGSLMNHYQVRVLVCGQADKYNRTYYQNSGSMPSDKSIYYNFPEGGTIEYFKIDTSDYDP